MNSIFDFAYLVIPLFIIFYTFYSSNANYWRKKGVRGPMPLPVVGNLLDVIWKPLNLVEVERYQKYGKVYGTFEGNNPVITIGDLELLRTVAITDFHNFRNRIPFFPNDPVLSLCLTDIKDDRWKAVRGIVTPNYTLLKLKQYYPLLERCVENAIEFLNEVGEKEEIHLLKFSTTFATDAIISCSFGVERNNFKVRNSEFVRNAVDLLEFNLIRIFFTFILPEKLQKFIGLHIIPEHILHYMANTLRRHLQHRRTSNVNRDDLAKRLLDAEQKTEAVSDKKTRSDNRKETVFEKYKRNIKLNEDEILAQLFIVLDAGFETTSAFLNFFFYTMAVERECQDKLFAEIRQHFERNNGDLNHEELMSLPYLDAVINETLRLYPPVVAITRVCENDYVLGNTGIKIDKGTVVNLPYYAIHHDPELYPSPFEFRPERFSPENKDQIPPYAFLAFGIGPRKCVGGRFAMLGTKILIARILNEFEIRKSPKTPKKLVYRSVFLALSSNPLFVRFSRRK